MRVPDVPEEVRGFASNLPPAVTALVPFNIATFKDLQQYDCLTM
jgi:hypothetical protein